MLVRLQKPLAPEAPPVSFPPDGPPPRQHRAADVAMPGRHAPGGCPVAASRAIRSTLQGWPTDQNMPMPAYACASPEEINQGIPRGDPARRRAWMARRAAAIKLTGRNAGQPELRAFAAPDRPIAVPDVRGRADKVLAARNDRNVGVRRHRCGDSNQQPKNKSMSSDIHVRSSFPICYPPCTSSSCKQDITGHRTMRQPPHGC